MTRDSRLHRAARPQRRTLFALLLLAVAVPAPLAPSAAQAGPNADRCEVTQVTSTTQAHPSEYGNQLGRESLSGDGSRLVFESDRDLTGQNPDGQIQVYFHDTNAIAIRQVTSTRGGGPVIAADGTRVAFGAWDGVDSGEIYAYDPDTDMTTQLTSDDRGKVPLSISADGTRVLYLADVDDSGVLGTIEVVDTTTTSTIEVAANAGRHVHRESSVLSPDGNQVAFSSRADITGENPDGSAELFFFDAAAEVLTQITSAVDGVDGGGNTGDVQFTDNGSTVIFSTDAAIVGPNPARESHDYRYDVATGTTTLVPDTPVGRSGFVVRSADGGRVAGTSDQDPTGANADHNYELFSGAPLQGFTQLTSSESSQYVGGVPFSVSTDGSVIAFLATANLGGGNPDHNSEIYLATTCDPSPRPDVKIAPASSGPYTGRHLYAVNSTPGQALTRPVRPAATRKFFVRIQNERDASDTFTLSGRDAGANGYQVTYLAGTVDITAAVEAGTYTVGPLGPGESVTVKVRIRAVSAAANSHHVADLTARSQTNPVAGDTVRAKVTRT